MRVAFDSRPAKDTGGIGRYTSSLLAALRATGEGEIVESHSPRRCDVFHAPWIEGALLRPSVPMVVTLHGKGSKTRRVPVMDPTAQLIQDYLSRRTPHPGVGADADPLFNGPQHSRLTRWGISKILARHVQSLRRRDPGYAAGVNVTPHVIRRTRAMHLLQAGVNLIYIRDLLGHADVSTTEIYARADAETRRKAIESAYQSLTPEPLPDWTADQDLLAWLDQACE